MAEDDSFIEYEERKKIQAPAPTTLLNVVPTRINDKGDISTSFYETKKRVRTEKGSVPALSLKIVRTRPNRDLISAEIDANETGSHLEINHTGEIINGPFPAELEGKVSAYLKDFKKLLKDWEIETGTTHPVVGKLPMVENKVLPPEPQPAPQVTKEIEKETDCTAESISLPEFVSAPATQQITEKTTKTPEFKSLIRPPEVQIAIPGPLKFQKTITLRKTVHGTLVMGLKKEIIEAIHLTQGVQFELKWNANSIVFTPQKTKSYPVKLFDMGCSLSVTFPKEFTPSNPDPKARFRWNAIAKNKLELLEVCRGEERKEDLKLRDATCYRESHLLTIDKKTVSELKLSAGTNALWSVVGNSYQLELTEKKQHFVNVMHHNSPTNHIYYIVLPKAFISGKIHEKEVICFSTNEKGQLIASHSEEKAQIAAASPQPASGAYDPVRRRITTFE